jgi:hypothetical protein
MSKLYAVFSYSLTWAYDVQHWVMLIKNTTGAFCFLLTVKKPIIVVLTGRMQILIFGAPI